jgi:hypothetical protein
MRRATEADLAAVTELVDAAHRHYQSGPPRPRSWSSQHPAALTTSTGDALLPPRCSGDRWPRKYQKERAQRTIPVSPGSVESIARWRLAGEQPAEPADLEVRSRLTKKAPQQHLVRCQDRALKPHLQRPNRSSCANARAASGCCCHGLVGAGADRLAHQTDPAGWRSCCRSRGARWSRSSSSRPGTRSTFGA